MSPLQPVSYEPYEDVLTLHKDDGAHKRLYPIVVHGTTFGRDSGSWAKRVANGSDYPFCAKLSEQLKMFGVRFPVWLNCDELEMPEFEWSGLNEHHARLKAARELASYINTCHEKSVYKYDDKPVFILIGHSHGGNVILASLGLLRSDVALGGIFLMGTPFFLYTEKQRREKDDDNELDYPGYRNIYLSAPVRCPFYLYFAIHGDEIDEVHSFFPLFACKSTLRE